MIVITGAAEPIGNAFTSRLIEEEYGDIIVVDEAAADTDWDEKRISAQLRPEGLSEWINEKQLHIQFIFHLSEKPDTGYLKMLWNHCVEFGLPFVFLADETFNQWIENQERSPYFWAGLKLAGADPADAAELVYFMMHHRKDSGIYDLIADAEKLHGIGFHGV